VVVVEVGSSAVVVVVLLMLVLIVEVVLSKSCKTVERSLRALAWEARRRWRVYRMD
jgi:hypothetical protein